ncbi:hypothetical protein AB0L50_15225 [Streptomyces flaveolus]|uniref:hypothetical protein n=1 Tax=Streptomyces flaveolus TaxID=67297 RepID=UPI003417B81E
MIRAGDSARPPTRASASPSWWGLRTAPAAARTWLGRARPTYDAGSTFTPASLPALALALGRAYDILIRLHRVRAADVLMTGRGSATSGLRRGLTPLRARTPAP